VGRAAFFFKEGVMGALLIDLNMRDARQLRGRRRATTQTRNHWRNKRMHGRQTPAHTHLDEPNQVLGTDPQTRLRRWEQKQQKVTRRPCNHKVATLRCTEVRSILHISILHRCRRQLIRVCLCACVCVSVCLSVCVPCVCLPHTPIRGRPPRPGRTSLDKGWNQTPSALWW
jgi:hypothetical protein